MYGAALVVSCLAESFLRPWRQDNAEDEGARFAAGAL